MMMTTRWMKLALACGGLGYLAACGGTEAPAPEEAAAPGAVTLDVDKYGWLTQVAWEPEAFAAILETDHDGWVKMHANDFEGAANAFGDESYLARSRAEWELAMLYRDLARYSAKVHEQFFTTWNLRAGFPDDSSAPVVASLAAYCGETGRLGSWTGKVKETMPGAELVEAMERGLAPWDASGQHAVTKRMEVHGKALGGDLGPFLEVANTPLISEGVPPKGSEGEFLHEFYDPCVQKTLETYWTQRASSSMGGTDWIALNGWTRPSAVLTGKLFAAWLTTEDFEAAMRANMDPGTLGARDPSLRRLGVGIDPHHGDDVQGAREEVRSLDIGLEGWKTDILAQANDDGKALMTDLGLVERFRQEWLIARARYALLEDRPKQTLAYLELARDVSDGAVGPNNHPAVFALLAEAQLSLGHSREALDALQILSEAYPTILGLQEITGDLVVLENMDRQGDSKEN